MTGRDAYAVHESCTRPRNETEFHFLIECINDWTVIPEKRKIMKRILNVEDCRIAVDSKCILVEAPNHNGSYLVIDINHSGCEWVKISV